MRVSNKHKKRATREWAKHPRKYLKRLGGKRLRKDRSDVEAMPKPVS